MKIARIEAFAIRLPRDTKQVTGTAGSPTQLDSGPFDYRWSRAYPALYSTHFETTLVRIEASNGQVGWGEAQAPLAPQVAATIVETLLRPAIEGGDFEPTAEGIARLWDRMYSTMRVRGQTGGFMLDAISGVDIALWDLAGKAQRKPVAALLGAPSRRTILPAYLSGLPKGPIGERIAVAEHYWDQGFRTIKLFHDAEEPSLLALLDSLRARFDTELRIAVDALWRLSSEPSAFVRELDERNLLWLECPLPPEDVGAHSSLARSIRTPLALGESYRTHWEIRPFLDTQHIRWLQPDLGRCGITQAVRWAQLGAPYGVAIVPHVSIAMGPQIAAALHFAAATAACPIVEFNPQVFAVANEYLTTTLDTDGPAYVLPSGPGLGTTLHETKIRTLAAITRRP